MDEYPKEIRVLWVLKRVAKPFLEQGRTADILKGRFSVNLL